MGWVCPPLPVDISFVFLSQDSKHNLEMKYLLTGHTVGVGSRAVSPDKARELLMSNGEVGLSRRKVRAWKRYTAAH